LWGIFAWGIWVVSGFGFVENLTVVVGVNGAARWWASRTDDRLIKPFISVGGTWHLCWFIYSEV
jgi:hypothetical protein